MSRLNSPLLLLTCVMLLGIAACRSDTPIEAVMPTRMETASVEEIVQATVEDVEQPPATFTTIPTSTDSPTPGPSLTPSITPTASQTATITPIPSETPTSVPQYFPTLAQWTRTVPEGSTPTATPPTAVPTQVPLFEIPDGTTNVLLIGADDIEMGGGVQRSDTLIIVSINRETETASMISIPRDLYVFIPGWTMNRINTAISHGRAVSYPGGGIGLLKDTILYNFGIPIHYYAEIDFDGFTEVVDAIGGVEITVTCSLTDWRIISPELDPEDEDNWELWTLPAGTHTIDGDTALWYVRSRKRSNDWDRGRRQQQILRALLNNAVDLNLVSEVPSLWNSYQDTVGTDLDIGRILQFASLAPAIRENGVQHLYLAGKTVAWTVPTSGAAVHLPVWEGEDKMGEAFQRLYLPPSLTSATRAPIVVELINASGDPGISALAAENFAWYGFAPIISDATVATQATTEVTYFASNFKGSYDWLLRWVAGIPREDIVLDSQTSSDADYQVVLGSDYDTCLNELYAPQIFLDTDE